MDRAVNYLILVIAVALDPVVPGVREVDLVHAAARDCSECRILDELDECKRCAVRSLEELKPPDESLERR
jgi:hypothetical protein